MTEPNRPLHVSDGPGKVTPQHLQRLAIIYIRQSTTKQVLHNRESQVNQYQMVQRAADLGWDPSRIRVIDTDLGVSGRSSENRDGFQELVAEVSLGHVGIILGYEVSRLARNNSDWYYLLDLAALLRTLIADSDGLYDPRQYNDRLLLGLKGTMSEAELHLLRLRLDAGRMRKVERGEYCQRLPAGLVRLAGGAVVKDPDDQVRHTIELVLSKFEELGSAHQLLQYLWAHDIQLPRGRNCGPLQWKHPTASAVLQILHNPAYAGAFAYGRKQADPSRRSPTQVTGGIVSQPLTAWIHLQQDVYPAYISWEQYLANQERLRQNATHYAPSTEQPAGASREGAALLQGLVRCGRCGRRMAVLYDNGVHRYVCRTSHQTTGEPICATLYGPPVDEVVVQAFFEALRPAQLDALEAVLSTQQTERGQLLRQWEERLKRAQYEADWAQHQYDEVDPGNRLVAAELERRWEEKLRQLRTEQENQDRFLQIPGPVALPPELREQFQHVSDVLPDLWRSNQLAHAQKKELLRSLIAQVILNEPSCDTVAAKIVWVSGHYSSALAQTPAFRTRDLGRYAEMVERVHEFWQQDQDDAQIAAQLQAEGFRSARSVEIPTSIVQKIRLEHGWHRTPRQSRGVPDQVDGYLSVKRLAEILGVSKHWVFHRLHDGRIEARYVQYYPQKKAYLIQDDPELIEQLRQALRRPRANGGS